ncbi:hypothetical protein A6A08_07545 [Nocardiopsis sp. TSRI0078]|uniref:DUF1998 domain-containing protein n=1 Tax=unclassified Nocardiopsis TaxID=2649073 RepID=UPI00093FDE48|nr:DUF1998 domain-containing protein [Nocardiopsis sp. TSRI0078]OKI17100.1 hypothetical protein A6A08_07545 [Nocardiopsis sp. TSRI0078]
MHSETHRRRVGSVRPSHLMFTSGVGSLVDLPNFAVLVRGLDDWNHTHAYGWEPIVEPRLLRVIQEQPGNHNVKELRPAPWTEGLERDPGGPAARVGVPTTPFPSWFRCTACDELVNLDSGMLSFENTNPRRPHEARFVHNVGKHKRAKPLAVPARFVLACTDGHLDEFPYVHFVHRGQDCAKAEKPLLRMEDRGGNVGANVELTCVNCDEHRNMRDAGGERGKENLPLCRGRHPHLGTFDPDGCGKSPKTLVLGASNQWFSELLSTLAVPSEQGTGELDSLVEKFWDMLEESPKDQYKVLRQFAPPMRDHFGKWDDDTVHEAVERRRAVLSGQAGGDEDDAPSGHQALRTAEWRALSAADTHEPHPDFTLRRPDGGVPEELRGVFADVVQAERLREVRVLTGFTRLDSPDLDDPMMVQTVRLSREAPTWLPASEVRGEGVFLRVGEDLLSAWEKRVAESHALELHREAYGTFREKRYSDRVGSGFERMRHWPGARYVALHTLSHLLIRTIALDCGYNAASLSERVYAGTEDDPRGGILIYTAVPDAEGTLGGLVSQAEPDRLVYLVRKALRGAMRCSSDPLCAERLPQANADFLHGAACHVCLFVSETTCERGNRFLDRRFVVPVGDPDLALYPELP